MMIILVFAALLFIAGIGFCLVLLSRKRVASQWPLVTGTIREARLEESRSDGVSNYSLSLLYDYEFANAQHQGTTSSWRIYPTRQAAVVDLANYPEGGPLPIRVNPTDPTNSEVFAEGNSKERVVRLLLVYVVLLTADLVAMTFAKPLQYRELIMGGVFLASAGLMLFAAVWPILKIWRRASSK